MRIDSVCCLCSFAASVAASLALLVSACRVTLRSDGSHDADPDASTPDPSPTPTPVSGPPPTAHDPGLAPPAVLAEKTD
jgi:hypothetical protein